MRPYVHIAEMWILLSLIFVARAENIFRLFPSSGRLIGRGSLFLVFGRVIKIISMRDPKPVL